MGKLTQKKVRGLTEPGRYGDGDGLFLHIRPGGSRQWILRVTVQGKRKDIGLGSASLVSLTEAREDAHQKRRMVRQGIDPLIDKKKNKATPTYREAADVVWQQNKPTWKNPKHAEQWISTQRAYAFPVLGEKKIDQITSAHVLEVLTPIWLTKSETARRLKQRMKTVFDWAKASGHRSGDSPMEGIDKALPKQSRVQEHHAALPWVDVPAFVAQLRERDAVSARALEMLILTGVRSSEVRLAKWSEIDVASRVWTIPAARMKMKKEHRVPLAPAVFALLELCSKLGSEYVFPSDNPLRPLSSGAFDRLFERMDVKDITTHGFRSSFRDWASETDSGPREIAEMALAHEVGDATEKAYARSDLLERRRVLMEKWAAFVTGRPSIEHGPSDVDD